MTEHIIPALIPRDKEDKKSCLNCPALKNEHDGSLSCGAKLIPLTVRSWDNTTRKLAVERQASNCEMYGTRKSASDLSGPQFVELKRPNVIFPVERASVRPTIPRLSTSSYSCVKCKHFIHESATKGTIPLSASFLGVCGARGIAIPAGKQVELCGDCNLYEQGEFPVEGLMLIKLGPEYNPEYLQKRAGLKTSHLPDGFDPVTYPSELQVSDYHAEHGIRAWVGIKDPKTTNKVFLPIYRADYFESEEQVKIPSSSDDTLPGEYVDHSGLVFKVAVAWMELDETPALIGEAGNGKTELLRHIAWIMQLPFERITITASSEVDDLAGKFVFEDGETAFKYGRLARAWGKPNVLCLDEPNTGPNDVLQFIRPLIDNSKQLVLDQNKGEQIFRNDGCYLGMAMNPHFDYRNIGANPMADADNSRLLHLEVPLPPETVEREIVKSRLMVKDGWEIPDKLLDSVVAIARTLREMSHNNEVPFSWGIRVQIKVARLLHWFDFHDAYLMAMGSSVDEETRDKVISVVKANTPSRK